MDNILLLKTLLLSTSQINILKYCKDKKKRGRIIGTAVAYALRVKNIERSDSGSLALTKNGRRRADALKKAIEKANG